jgi:predicted RNase H-like nuclease (RuvC/YqgF family)
MGQGVDIASIISVIVALFGGGVTGVVIKALTEKKKINAEAENTNIKSLLEIDQRMNERMANLEERVANLEQENYKLKSEKLSLEKETHKLKLKIIELQEENQKLCDENQILKAELDTLKKEIEKEEN